MVDVRKTFVLNGLELHSNFGNSEAVNEIPNFKIEDVNGYLYLDTAMLTQYLDGLSDDDKVAIILYLLSLDIVFKHLINFIDLELITDFVDHFFEKFSAIFDLKSVDGVEDIASNIYTRLGDDNFLMFNIGNISVNSESVDSASFNCVEHRSDLFDHFHSQVINVFDEDTVYGLIINDKILYDQLSNIFPKNIASYLFDGIESIFSESTDKESNNSDDNEISDDNFDEAEFLIPIYYKLLFAVNREEILASYIGLELKEGAAPSHDFTFLHDENDDLALNRFYRSFKSHNFFKESMEFLKLFSMQFDALQATSDSEHGIEDFDNALFDMFFNFMELYFKKMGRDDYLEMLKVATSIIITFSNFGDELALYLMPGDFPIKRFDN